jgi:hypothetical protein
MTAPLLEVGILIAQLEQLKRQNRWLKAIGLIVISLVVCITLMAANVPPKDIVEARAFIIRDNRGTIRGELSFDHKSGETRLRLAGNDGTPRFVVDVTNERSELFLKGENPKSETHIFAVKANLGLLLKDQNHNGRLLLARNNLQDLTSIAILDANGFALYSIPSQETK